MSTEAGLASANVHGLEPVRLCSVPTIYRRCSRARTEVWAPHIGEARTTGGWFIARLDDLVARVEDQELRREIESELKPLRDRKQFGLVFEPDEPEFVATPASGLRPGQTVLLREARLLQTRQPAARGT